MGGVALFPGFCAKIPFDPPKRKVVICGNHCVKGESLGTRLGEGEGYMMTTISTKAPNSPR